MRVEKGRANKTLPLGVSESEKLYASKSTSANSGATAIATTISSKINLFIIFSLLFVSIKFHLFRIRIFVPYVYADGISRLTTSAQSVTSSSLRARTQA